MHIQSSDAEFSRMSATCEFYHKIKQQKILEKRMKSGKEEFKRKNCMVGRQGFEPGTN